MYNLTSLVGHVAPNFNATAIMPDNSINVAFNLHDYLEHSLGILFFYPLDFTFVCPSEILTFNSKIEEFHKRRTKIIAVSVDSHYTHLAYKNTPTSHGGIGNIQMPMVSDLTKEITKSYGILHDNKISLRGTFLIDQHKIIRHMIVNDLPLGRNIEETMRMVDALLHHEQYGEVCPANWKPGENAMQPNIESTAKYLSDKNFGEN